MTPGHTQITTQELFLLEAWVAENPGSRLFVRLGRAYLGLGRPVDAVQALRRGLLVMPEDIEARHLLALALREMGDRAGALAESLTAARAIAEQADVFKLLGEVLKDEGRSQEAAWAAGVARELALTPAATPGEARPPAACAAPGQAPAMTPAMTPAGPETATLAEIYAAQGLNQQAAAIYRRLVELNPGDAALAARLAELQGRAAPAPAAPAPGDAARDAAPAASPPPSPPPAKAGPVLARLEALRRSALGQARGGRA